jgi:hypothetical protein
MDRIVYSDYSDFRYGARCAKVTGKQSLSKSLIATVSAAFAHHFLSMDLRRLLAWQRRHLPADSCAPPVSAAPRAHAPFQVRTPNTSPLVARPTTRARSPPPPLPHLVRIASAAIRRAPASSGANNTIVVVMTLLVIKMRGKKRGERRTHAIETFGIVYVVDRRSSRRRIVAVLTVFGEQSGEPGAQRGLVRVCRDVSNEDDTAGRVTRRSLSARRRRRLMVPTGCGCDD